MKYVRGYIMLIRKKYIALGLVSMIVAASGSLMVFSTAKTKASVTKVKTTKVSPQNSKKWSLCWQDEFNGANGSDVDKSKWVHDIGGDGWGNSEDEYYTDGNKNCYIQNGNLVIEAKKEKIGNNQYTSARIKTKGKFEFKYGKVEIRAKIPYGQGVWPALWMLGANIDSAKWPNCGEADIMENIGKEPKIIHGTMHGPGYSGALGIGYPFQINEDFSKAYHIFGLEWSKDKLDWFVDGKKYLSTNAKSIFGNKWVFNEKFYLLINLAIGGQWPGEPDNTTKFSQKFYVDYVRVYK
jgi:beta-glucanase (GH16 family)